MVLYHNYTVIGARYKDIISIYNHVNSCVDAKVIDLSTHDIAFYEPIMKEFNQAIHTSGIKPSVIIRSKNTDYKYMLPDTILTYNATYMCTINNVDHLFQNGDMLQFKGFVLDAYPSVEDLMHCSVEHSNIMARRCKNGRTTMSTIDYRYSLKFINIDTGYLVFIPLCYTIQTESSYVNANGVDNTVFFNRTVYSKDVVRSRTSIDIAEQIGMSAYYPVIASNIMTFHRSQGKTIENVIISIDSMFDVGMLYTGITRASKNVVFYTKYHNMLINHVDRCDLLFTVARVPEFIQLKLMTEVIMNERYERKNKRDAAKNKNKNVTIIDIDTDDDVDAISNLF